MTVLLILAVAHLVSAVITLLAVGYVAREKTRSNRGAPPEALESWLDHRAGVHADPCPYRKGGRKW